MVRVQRKEVGGNVYLTPRSEPYAKKLIATMNQEAFWSIVLVLFAMICYVASVLYTL